MAKDLIKLTNSNGNYRLLLQKAIPDGNVISCYTEITKEDYDGVLEKLRDVVDKPTTILKNNERNLGLIENSNKIKKIGIFFVVFGMLFAIVETIYFGSSYLPETKLELFCDIFSSLFIFFGSGLAFTCNILQKYYYD